MIEYIKEHEILSSYVEKECCENGVCVTFEDTIETESYVIIKVDNYYNALNLEKTPPSIDCLIIRECKPTGKYGITLVELKKGSSSAHFDFDNIKKKFETTLYDFLQIKFPEILSVEFADIKLFLVSNKEIYKRDLGLKMDVLINIRFKFNNKNLMITPRMPNPTLKNCYS